MSLRLLRTSGSRRYTGSDVIMVDENPDVILYDHVSYPLTDYLRLMEYVSYGVIVTSGNIEGTKIRIIGEINPHLKNTKVIDYRERSIGIPLFYHYPVIRSSYAIIPRDVFTSGHRIMPSLTDPTPSIMIHQSYETLVLPSSFPTTSWIDHHPDYSYRYYTPRDCQRILDTHFPPRVGKAYRDLYPGAFKCDLWRVCQLYLTGGLYSDIKQQCVASLTPLMKQYDLILVIDRIPCTIYNAVMVAPAGHPFLSRLIDRIVDNIERRVLPSRANLNLDLTGPMVVYEVFCDYFHHPPDQPLQPGSHDGYYLLSHCYNHPHPSIITDGITTYVNTRPAVDHITDEICYRSSGQLHYGELCATNRIYESSIL